MEPKKLLYSERYPDYNKTIKQVYCENEMTLWLHKQKKENPDFEPALRYVPHPKRQETKKYFMKHIIDFSKKYNLDIDLFEDNAGYVAYLYVPTVPFRGFFKTELITLIKICDDSYFSSPEDLAEVSYENWDAKNWTTKNGYLIIALYYTHDIFLGDQKLTDLDE